MHLRTYVIQDDDGSAPNYDPPAVTLAICKPKIRKHAEIGDLLLAFEGSFLGQNPHAVVWAGVVTERLTFTQYWNDPRYRDKRPDKTSVPDNIYEPRGLEFRQVPNLVHGAGNASVDLGGRFVLVLDPAWHFGPPRPVLPASFGIRMPMTARRGHRVRPLSPPEWEAVRSWLDAESRARGGDVMSRRGGGCSPRPAKRKRSCAPRPPPSPRAKRC